MGIIMKDGHQYGVGGIEQADDISYDNTQSGLTATNAQDAIDELSAGLNAEPDLLYTVTSNGTGLTLAHSIANYRTIRFVTTNSDESRIFSTSDVHLSLARSKVFAANLTSNGTWNVRRISFASDTTINVTDSVSPDNIHILIYGVK